MSSLSTPEARRGDREDRALRRLLKSFFSDRSGSYATIGAVVALPLILGASVAIEYADASRLHSELQQVLDASVLAGAREKTAQVEAANNMFDSYFSGSRANGAAINASFTLGDGVLDGQATRPMELTLGFNLLTKDKTIGVRSQARFVDPENPPCITILSDTNDALRVNSGAKIVAPGCEIHVHSRKNTAVFVGAGSSLDVSKLCVRSTNTNIHGKVSKEEKNCSVEPDPYAGRIAEPTVPGSCATSGPKDGNKHTLKPGLHCNVNFNGSPTITFEPGLHVIRGNMNINSGATVIANGVTFYFPDTNSRIQANGSLRLTASAPTSGSYKGILMFEKTSDSQNNASKSPFTFNGSLGEQLTGVLYLPNRNIIYNSTTNIAGDRLSIVANTMIINSANWSFTGMGDETGGGERLVYLSR